MTLSLESEKLPNTFLIGAPKCGTTTLARMLTQHPDVYLPAQKEPDFFSLDLNYANGLEWYQRTHYADVGDAAIRLDASNGNLTWSTKVVPRMLENLPDQPALKFFAIFRDPVARAHSHYWMAVKHGREPLSFSEAIKQEDSRFEDNYDTLESEGRLAYAYKRAGQYFSNLQPYFTQFEPSQFHFTLFEDLISHPVKTVKEILYFLGLDTDIELEPIHENKTTAVRSRALFDYSFIANSPSRKLIRKLFPANLRRLLGKKLSDFSQIPLITPPIPGEIEKYLRTSLRSDTQALEKLMGRDLSHWY